ncbi:amino acid ABC transporter permease [Curtobacterium sp. MCSS17_005]|uniref:amino acid ABC transporter permease n=1 Tax=Curtobacterium sp. MCSS17_005 TaxID=2175641 RepID=UPI0011B38536|nr:amino acid ABC transporter permease [Curtobacterium sp. MCSS17_005]WIB34395.1 amino acid ABC transporter permease [Curtobacterium sp. MCSS17_005]
MFVQILSGIGMTLWVTALSLLIGSLIALPVVAARRSRIGWIRAVAGAYVNLVRAIPPITWLFLIYFGLPQFALRLDTFTAAVVGFSVISSAYMTEIYRSGLLSIPTGQWEAASALGMRFAPTTLTIITPQAFRVTLPAITTYAIALLKDSALASTIGVQDITFQANLAARSTHQGLLAFCIAGLLYIAISIPLAIATRRVDRRMRAKLEVA